MTDTNTNEGMTYKGTGIDYDAMDPFKVECQQAALTTSLNCRRLGFEMMDESRGESAPIVRYHGNGFWALTHVEEGLGSKNLVADAAYELLGKSYFDAIAQDTCSMIDNDVIQSGAKPLTQAMHLAVGSDKWFEDQARAKSLAWGWARACNLAHVTWVGGETPTLKDIIIPGTVVLAGSATGIIEKEQYEMSEKNIRVGDLILHLASSGVHANGITMTRSLRPDMTDIYMQVLTSGKRYVEAILEPTIIYEPILQLLETRPGAIHYMVNITGHGWRKHMRPKRSLAYVIEIIPEPQPEFSLIQSIGNVAIEEMYSNFNMGVGFALYVDPEMASEIVTQAEMLGFHAWIAGHIKESTEREVTIKPLGITYSADSLKLR